MRTLKAGTVIHLAGSSLPMVLKSDAPVEFAGDANDSTFIGHLHKNKENFALNAPDVGNGQWNPVTAAAMKSECVECGAEIPVNAENQETCANCLSKERILAAQEEAPKAAKKRTSKAKPKAKK